MSVVSLDQSQIRNAVDIDLSKEEKDPVIGALQRLYDERRAQLNAYLRCAGDGKAFPDGVVKPLAIKSNQQDSGVAASAPAMQPTAFNEFSASAKVARGGVLAPRDERRKEEKTPSRYEEMMFFQMDDVEEPK